MVHDGASQLVDAVLLLLGEAQHIKRFLKLQHWIHLAVNNVEMFFIFIFFDKCSVLFTSVAISSSLSSMDFTVVSPWEM